MVFEEQNSDIEFASEVVPVPQIQPKVQASDIMNIPNVETNNIPHGNHRQRKRALHAAILKQMEFYFSDSNLSKDRFLASLIKQDPNVDLDVFLRFNKIRSLTTDKNRIAKALRKSTMLQVSEDSTKVYRITPIVEKKNVDECTVYVQRLPSDADHEWLSTLFSEYGPVAYVSIPKFKFNHKIKGFAFVEFETPEAAQKCLKAFEAKGYLLQSHTSPTDVLSITTYAEEEKVGQNGIENLENSNEKNSIEKVNENNQQKIEKSSESEKYKTKKKKKKSLKSDDPGDSGTDQSDIKIKKKKDNDETDSTISHSDLNMEIEEKRGKKRKTRLSSEGISELDSESQKISKENCKKNKKLKVEDSETEVELEISTKSESEKIERVEKVTKNRNEENAIEKKKKKKRNRKNHGNYEVLKAPDMGLQVMDKKNWKQLRNKYLDLQRSKMKQLKQHMKRARWNQWGDKNKMEIEQEEAAKNKKENQASNLKFISGVIVKVELKEPCVDPKTFKMELRSNNNIKYIDIKEGSSEAFIRCDSSEAAAALSQKASEENCFKILTGEEEKCYWDKIVTDREAKIGNKVRVKQRGRDKLLKKAEKELGKHIKFDKV